MPGNPVGNRIIHSSIALGALITLAVPLRLLARWKSKANFAMDDVLMIISLIPQYVMIALGVIGSSFDHCLVTSKLTCYRGPQRRDGFACRDTFPEATGHFPQGTLNPTDHSTPSH